jgi:hypothetical protein
LAKFILFPCLLGNPALCVNAAMKLLIKSGKMDFENINFLSFFFHCNFVVFLSKAEEKKHNNKASEKVYKFVIL